MKVAGLGEELWQYGWGQGTLLGLATLYFHVKDLAQGTILRYGLVKVQAMLKFH